MLTTSRNYLIVMIQIIVDQNSSPDVSVLGGRLKMMRNLLRVCSCSFFLLQVLDVSIVDNKPTVEIVVDDAEFYVGTFQN